METFHLLNFGCRASQADGSALKRQMLEAGFRESAQAEQSQVAILNTCTVTAAADAEIRRIIRRLHRLNPACRILVTGCYAQRAPEELRKLAGVYWVVGNSHKHSIAELLKGEFGEGSRIANRNEALRRPPGSTSEGESDFVPLRTSGWAAGFGSRNPASPVVSRDAGKPEAAVVVGDIGNEFHFAPVFSDDRTRPTLKVQDGCNARCSFCVIPFVRGPSRSLRPDKVVEQVLDLERSATREIVLSGINIGSYGKDLEPRLTFLGLLERILRETSVPRLRISSIEPMDVSCDLIRLVAREPRLARHFHVPLQSGCDRILRLMNRRYWTTQYAERLHEIRAELPDCGIGADVMVGFPGETDEDHQESLRFIASLPFTYLHIFPFSPRPGTPAAVLPSQVDGRRARERGRDIRLLMQEKRKAFLAAQAGRALSVLTLDEIEQGTRVALSSNYLKVLLPGTNLPANALLDVRVGRALEDRLYAYPEA